MTVSVRREENSIQGGAAKEMPRRSSKGLGLFGALGILVAAGLLLASAGFSQDVKPEGREPELERKAIVHFATLSYLPTNGTTEVRVPASILERVQLVRPHEGATFWIELFYRGGDYVLQKVDKLTFLRRDANSQQMKVQVNLVHPARMGFPFVN